MTTQAQQEEIAREIAACSEDYIHFIENHCFIFEAVSGEWIPFELWAEQIEAVDSVHDHQFTIILKARQLGLTWLILAYALWLMLFRPASIILLYSKGKSEAQYLLDWRLRGMHERLPEWMTAGQNSSTRSSKNPSKSEFQLQNGSIAYSFPRVGGDGYTATLALADEADLHYDLGQLMKSVRATVDAGGKLVLLSRVDKDRPNTEFKRIYRGAKAGKNAYCPIFLPWYVHPDRTVDWYKNQERDCLVNTHALDRLHEQYPTTDDQALKQASLKKRLPPDLLNKDAVWEELPPIYPQPANLPAGLEGIRLYNLPGPGEIYRIGVDCAEGVDGGDDSVAAVINMGTGELVAHLSGKFEPMADWPSILLVLSAWFNDACLLIERNNHGHAVIGYIQAEHAELLLRGPDGRYGWSNQDRKAKADLYDTFAFDLKNQGVLIHDWTVHEQLGAIDRITLAHPAKKKGAVCVDDEAMACVLANKARYIEPDVIRLARADGGGGGESFQMATSNFVR